MSRHFPHWLKAYIDYTRASEAPTQFHFWCGVSTLAGALRRKVWRDELIFQWTPNFYIILVAPAGVVQKSTSIDLGMELLRRVPGIHFGPESLTWQALGESFMDSREFFDYTNGSGEISHIPMSALTIPISELGTFLMTDDSKFLSFITTMWDGRRAPFKHKTRTQELIDIERPWLNIIGATTPTWIRNNIGSNMIGEGLISRIIFVYAERKRSLVAYPSRHVRTKDFYLLEDRLVEDLTTISNLSGPFELTLEAELWGEKWYEAHNTTRPPHMASDRYGGYLARKQGHLHKLAMILSAAKRDDLVLQKEDLEEANKLLTDSEGSMIRVFESIGVVEEAEHVATVVSYVRVYKWLSIRELYFNFCHNIMEEKSFKQAVRLAVEGSLLKKEIREGQVGLSPVERTVN